MKTKIFIQVFFTILSFSFCSSQEMTENGFKYKLIAKLEKNYEHDCDCQSRFINNKMFNFKVVEINMKEYSLKDINIIIPCPEGYGEDFFKKGNMYQIEFYDNCTDMNSDAGVCDYDIPKRKRMNRRFWVHSIANLELEK